MTMKLINPPFGNMSGSLGGLTFRTQGNQTVVSAKKIGTPIQSKIQQQTSHIQIEVANNWGELTAEQKSGWDNFAITNFKPRKTTNKGTESGYNAYFSLNATAKKLQLIQIPSVVSSNGIVINEDDTNNVYTEIKTPPTNPLTTTIATTSDTDNIQVALASVERVENTINFTLEITTTTSESFQLEQPLQDSNGNPITFTIYSSPAKNYETQKSNKKFNSILFSTSPVLVSTSPAVEGSIVLSVSIDDIQSCVPSNYNLDKFIDLGLCICSTTGMLQYVNNLTVQVKDIYKTPNPLLSKNIIAYPSYSSPYAILYNTQKDIILNDIWECNMALVTSAISEKYIAMGGTYQTAWNSSVRVYNKISGTFIECCIGLTQTIVHLWLNNDWLYVKLANTQIGYPQLFRVYLTTGTKHSCPSIENAYIRDMTFSDEYVYVCGTSNIYSGQSIFKMHEGTGNTENIPFTTTITYDHILIDTTRNILILVQGETTNGLQQIINLTTGALLDEQITSSNGSYGASLINDSVYTVLKTYTSPYAMMMKTNLDTYLKTSPATNYCNAQNWQTVSQGKLYSASMSKYIDSKYFGVLDEEQNKWVGNETIGNYKGYELSGIP